MSVLYALLLALALVALYLVLRRKSRNPAPGRRGATQFGNDTTAFQSMMDSRLPETQNFPGEARHRGLSLPATAWNAQVFRDIEWRRFEAVCVALFAQAGFETRLQSRGADGADIWLHAPETDAPAAVVRCVHGTGKPVGAAEMREFQGVMAAHKLQRGTFAASGTFTAEAREVARSSGISALDGLVMLAMISKRGAQQQKDLLQVAYEGEYWRPTCASCGLKMVEHNPRKGGASFWGCADAPRCAFTLPVRTAG